MTVTDSEFSGLSGDVVVLQDAVLDNERLILGLPSKLDFDTLQTYNAQQFNNIDCVLVVNSDNIDKIIDYVHSLKFLYSTVQNTLSVHTGLSGEHIDWTQAHNEGKMKNKDILPGFSPTLKRLKETHEIKMLSKRKGFPNIIFSHKKHSVWNGCNMCHPILFALKAGKTKFEMQDIFEGRYCGACHGTVAFPTQECQRCHSE